MNCVTPENELELSGHFSKRDFYRMDNYTLRLRPEAARKLIDALRIKFNSPAAYKRKFCSWNTLIRLKAQELANYTSGRRSDLDFEEPRTAVESRDCEVTKKQILSLTTAEAKRIGISRNMLWYLQERAGMTGPMRVYRKVKARLV